MEPKNKSVCGICKQCPIGTLASAKWQKTVTEKKTQIWYEKGHYVFYEGRPVFGMFLVTEGKVKILTRVSKERSQIVRLASDGHILGRQGKKDDIYGNSAVAIGPSLICFVTNDILDGLLLENPKLTLRLMSYYSKELRSAEKRIKILAQLSAKERVVQTLLYAHSVFGVDGNSYIDAEFSRTDVAEIAGISHETVSRVFGNLSKDKLIKSRGKKVQILDADALNALGGSNF